MEPAATSYFHVLLIWCVSRLRNDNGRYNARKPPFVGTPQNWRKSIKHHVHAHKWMSFKGTQHAAQ